MKSKRAEEVAYTFLDNFTILGVPSILQSNNDREFCNQILEEICTKVKTQSQRSIERANYDVENMLTTETNQTSKWSEGLNEVHSIYEK